MAIIPKNTALTEKTPNASKPKRAKKIIIPKVAIDMLFKVKSNNYLTFKRPTKLPLAGTTNAD